MKESIDFHKDPPNISQNSWGDKRSGELKAIKKEVEEHICGVHSDLRCEDELEEMAKLIKPDEPTIPFEVS